MWLLEVKNDLIAYKLYMMYVLMKCLLTNLLTFSDLTDQFFHAWFYVPIK